MDEITKQLAELLERSGIDPAQARTEAQRAVLHVRTVQAGSSYGAQWPEDLARLWSAASRTGACLVLEIKAEGETRDEYTGHLNITVQEREDWVVPAPELSERRSSTWRAGWTMRPTCGGLRLNHATTRT